MYLLKLCTYGIKAQPLSLIHLGTYFFSDSESRKNNGAARQNFGAKTEKEGEKEATNFRGQESPGGGRYEDDRLIH